jgi:hypothetical protein
MGYPLRVGRNGLPQAPWEIQDEVELYAREGGRTAKLHFVPGGGWMARFSLRSNDKRMQLWQQGMAAEPPTEDVWFHVPNPRADQPGQPPYTPLDILQMGPSGVREFLERGNTWSGRGVHSSLMDAVKASADQEADRKQRLYEKNRQQARDMARDTRRSRLQIPFLRVGIDLTRTDGDTSKEI